MRNHFVRLFPLGLVLLGFTSVFLYQHKHFPISNFSASDYQLSAIWGSPSAMGIAWSPNDDRIALLTEAGIHILDSASLLENVFIPARLEEIYWQDDETIGGWQDDTMFTYSIPTHQQINTIRINLPNAENY
ncbi:MAG TPA: hypothetical protein PK299_16040 [Anaerolineales bacterium]|nr:hypothetical protein [Anaerolineales bacterium]